MVRPSHCIIVAWALLSCTASAFAPARLHDARYSITQRRSKKIPPSPSAHFSTTTKTLDEELLIKQVLSENSLFKNIPEASYDEVIDMCERMTAPRGEIIIRQGDSCKDGYVYLIVEGKCRVLVDNKTVPEPYGILRKNTVFGEMGVLYDEVRAATIKVESKSLVYYRITGELFKAALSGESSPTISLERMQEIDAVINTVSGTNVLYEGNVIPAYKPERAWLWRQFAGTVLKLSLETILFAMGASALFVIFAKLITNEPFLWQSDFLPPDNSDPLVQGFLSEVNDIWKIQKTLTTFVLTFFVNQSFRFWGDVYKSVREVQVKLSSFNLLLVTNVIRTADGSLTPDAERFLDEVGQCTRLFHILFWASRAKRFSVLTSDDGLKRMESRGLMSPKQLDILLGLDLPNDQRFSAPLEWMFIRVNRASDDGILLSDTATKGAILKQYMSLRDSFAKIGYTIEGRFPLAYVQFVQILVDAFVLFSPLALYVDLGEYSVIAVGLVTFFYCGLNNLAKIFLDPLNNEDFCENSIFFDLGVIIREANADSTRWRKAGKTSPFDQTS